MVTRAGVVMLILTGNGGVAVGEDAPKGRIGNRVLAALLLIVLGLVGWQFLKALARGREKTRRASCMSNLKQFGLALRMYAQDHDGVYPAGLTALYDAEYVTDPYLFQCPKARAAAGEPPAQYVNPTHTMDGYVPVDPELHAEKIDYCYIAGLRSDDDSGYIVMFDEEGNHAAREGGVNVLLADGNVVWLESPEKLHERMRAQMAALAARGRTMRVIRPKRAKSAP